MVAVSGGGLEPVPALAAEVPTTTIDDGRRRGSSIDVVVVRRRDGSLACTAFVVRFEPPTSERLSRGLSAAYASLERGVARLRSDDRRSAAAGEGGGGAADGDARPVRVAVNGAAVDCDLVAGADRRCRFAGGRGGLPGGPLVTSGEGLLGAVYAEVVAKTPDVFKTRALLDVAAAFGGDPGASPVVLGFGNRDTDAWQPPAWWAAATAPLTTPLGIERNDGVRLRLGKESDADAIRALWAENDETRPYNREAVGLPWRNAAPAGFDPTAFVGPVCVAAPKRGSGLFRDLYAGLFADLAPERAAVTVIDARNAPSLRAHEKVPGCERRGSFDAGGRAWVVFSFDLDAARLDLAQPPT
ncbi:phosphatidylinositol transporter [Aureococcus anophagefferens]|nr:phosphatidylinositol transporter [Aureococcus anophagefferens]